MTNEMMEMEVTKSHSYHLWDEYYNEEPNFSWVIDYWESLRKLNPSEMLSPVFPLKGYPFGAQAKLTLEDNVNLRASLAFKDLSNNKNELDLRVIPVVYYTFKCQNTKQPPSVIKIIAGNSYLFDTTLEYDTFNYDASLIQTRNVWSVPITIDVHVEPPSIAKRGVSHDGTLTWAINDFRKKRTKSKKYQRSPYFYTNPKGYKVQAEVWLNGLYNYEGKGLSVEISFLTGPYDASLNKSFECRTTVTLLHPTDPDKNITKSVDNDLSEDDLWVIDMATNEEVEKLLKEDTLHYKVQIVPI